MTVVERQRTKTMGNLLERAPTVPNTTPILQEQTKNKTIKESKTLLTEVLPN